MISILKKSIIYRAHKLLHKKIPLKFSGIIIDLLR